MGVGKLFGFVASVLFLCSCVTGVERNLHNEKNAIQVTGAHILGPCKKFWLEFDLRTMNPKGGTPEYWKAYSRWGTVVQPVARNVIEGSKSPTTLAPLLVEPTNRDAINYISNLQKEIVDRHFALSQESESFITCFEKIGQHELGDNRMDHANAWLYWADFLLAAEQLRLSQKEDGEKKFWLVFYQAVLAGALSEAYGAKQIPPRITSCLFGKTASIEAIRTHVRGRKRIEDVVLDFSKLVRDSARGNCSTPLSP